MDEPHVGAIARRALQADVEIHDLELVLDERPAGLAVLAAPFDIGEVDAVALDQEARAAIGERIDERSGAGGRIVVELGARPVEIAGMEEPREAIVGAIERAADEGRDMRRSQEAMPRELAHDRHVVVGEAKGGGSDARRNRGRRVDAAIDGGIHTDIIAASCGRFGASGSWESASASAATRRVEAGHSGSGRRGVGESDPTSPEAGARPGKISRACGASTKGLGVERIGLTKGIHGTLKDAYHCRETNRARLGLCVMRSLNSGGRKLAQA